MQPRNEIWQAPWDSRNLKENSQKFVNEKRAHLEDLLEEGTAGREYHLVRRETLSITGKGHVHQALFLPKALEAGRDIAEETVPL